MPAPRPADSEELAPPSPPARHEPAPVEKCEGTTGPFWECPTYGGNPMPLSTFKATSVETPTVFRVSAKLSDYYNYEYRGHQKTDYSVEVREDPRSFSGRLHVYIKRTAPSADVLFDLLKDGEPHMVTVELAYAKTSRSNDVAKLTRFICGDWHCDVTAK